MGIFSSVGKIFNDASGATAAAKQQYKWQKEFAQNAHQWEVADLEKAGLNPILSADGSGATGNIGMGQSGGGFAQGLVNSILDYTIMNKQNDISQQDTNAKTTLATAQTKKTEAETTHQILENKYVEPEKKAQLANLSADTEVKNKEAELTSAKKANEEMEWGKKQAEYEKLNQEAEAEMFANINNKSEAEFVQKYGMTKDQAIRLYETTGQIVGNIIPHKPTPNTKGTSAKKEPHFEKGSKNVIKK